MDWSTASLMNNSPLARRLPGQRTPPDPTIGQANAADITYGWHSTPSSSSEGEGRGRDETEGSAGRDRTRQEEAAQALRERRRERRTARRRESFSDSSSEGSIASYNSASAGTRETAIESEKNEASGSNSKGTALPNPADVSPDVDAESFICRICFDGSGSQDEGGETLGRLIAPCRCRGTMKFVHQACLTRWRATSMRQSSIVACDQCGSPYKFRKSRFVGLATNRLLILLVSCLMFIGLIWTVGFTAEIIIQRWDVPTDRSMSDQIQSSGKAKVRNAVWQTVFGEDEDGQQLVQDNYEDDMYAYGYGYASSFYWEPLYYYKLSKAAVKHVASGRATRAVKKLVQGDAKVVKAPKKESGWIATVLDDWKYGSGGIWEGQRPDSSGTVESHSASEAMLDEGGKESSQMQSMHNTPGRERYDAKTATRLGPGEEPVRPKKERESSSSTFQDLSPKSSGWWERVTLQFSLGFSLVGIFSFINLLLGVSFWGPFQLTNFGLGRSFARLTGGRRRGGGGGGSEGGTIASVLLLFLVIIGVLRALMAVISFTTYLSKRLLTRVEDYIVEYSGEEEEQGQREPRIGRAADPLLAPEIPPVAEGVAQGLLRRRWWTRR
ncbi:hypothetical protein CBS101457_005882 [Exobasidium rhododendri]|nr:hypothetical protein CBS101457_005882 [Exobasidium rhododendri]